MAGFYFQGLFYRREMAVTGTYSRQPVENGWHRGSIQERKQGDELAYLWVNEAGKKWNLIPDLEKEVLNVMVYSMVYLQKEFIEKKLTEEKLPKTTISITGHSLGGCLCSLFALYFYKLLKNPDFSKMVNILEEAMTEIQNGGYIKDEKQFVWEEAMQAVYGKNVFDWYWKMKT